MKLRNFLYVDSKLINNYISAIDGYVYDEEIQTKSHSKENTAGGKIGVSIATGHGSHIGKEAVEVHRSVRVSDAAKFDKIFNYISDHEKLTYHEFLSDDDFKTLDREDFIEVLVTPRFSRMQEISKAVNKLEELTNLIQGVTDKPLIDKDTKNAINGISALGSLKSGSKLACVFNFENNKYPMVAYLDESYFTIEREHFIGQVSMLCKIQKKILKGENIKLDEIFDGIKKMPLNREQRRKMPKSIDNPEIIKDVIRGPGFIVVPIAIYQ